MDTTSQMQNRRDLELVLFGVALGKSERDRVLVMKPGSFTRDIDPLFEAIRSQKPGPIVEFFRNRGVVLEKGMDFIDAVMAYVSESNRRARLNRIATELVNCRGGETTQQMVERFKLALKEVEEM